MAQSVQRKHPGASARLVLCMDASNQPFTLTPAAHLPEPCTTYIYTHTYSSCASMLLVHNQTPTKSQSKPLLNALAHAL
jgi:hypothetical protein